MSEVKAVSDGNFQELINAADLPVLLDFWAPWCGPCARISPHLADLASQFQGKLSVYSLNTDENPETPAKFDIRGIPTLLMLNRGQELDRVSGYLPLAELAAFVTRHLA